MSKRYVVSGLLTGLAISITALFGHPHVIALSSTLHVQEKNSSTIYFATFDGDTYNFYSMRDDGSDQRFLAQSNQGWFRPSPDGEHIVLTQHHSGSVVEGEYDLYLTDVGQSKSIRLTDEDHSHSPIWSPSGQKIAFVLEQPGGSTIYLVSVNENFSLTPLTDVSGWAGHLEWSSDESFLLFETCNGDLICGVYAINSDGTGLRNLTEKFGISISDLALSPNDKLLALTGNEEIGLTSTNIYILDLSDQTVSRLTDISATYSSLDWNPQGTWLAYASDKDGDWDIFLASSDNLHNINLTNNSDKQDGFYGLDWSPDGGYLVFSSGPVEGTFELFTISIEGSDLTRLTDNTLNDIFPIWGTTEPDPSTVE